MCGYVCVCAYTYKNAYTAGLGYGRCAYTNAHMYICVADLQVLLIDAHIRTWHVCVKEYAGLHLIQWRLVVAAVWRLWEHAARVVTPHSWAGPTMCASCLWLCAHACMCASECVREYVYVCISVCMHLCMFVCENKCVRMNVWLYAHVYVCRALLFTFKSHGDGCKDMHTFTCGCQHVCVYMCI